MKLGPGVRDILISVFLFSLMQICVKALPRIPAHEIVFFRGLVSLAVTAVLLRRAKVRPWGNSQGLLILRGVVGTLALVLFFQTLHRVPLAAAATMQHLSPVFTLLLGALLLGERPSWKQVFFFCVAFAGVAVIKGADARISLMDAAMGLGSAFCSGMAYNLVRRSRDTENPLVVVFYFPLVTVPTVGAYTVFHWVQPQGIEWLYLLFVGIATQFAQLALTRAYQADRVGNVAQFTYLGTLLAAFWGFFLFGEQFTAEAIAGFGIMLFGVLMATRYRVPS